MYGHNQDQASSTSRSGPTSPVHKCFVLLNTSTSNIANRFGLPWLDAHITVVSGGLTRRGAQFAQMANMEYQLPYLLVRSKYKSNTRYSFIRQTRFSVAKQNPIQSVHPTTATICRESRSSRKGRRREVPFQTRQIDKSYPASVWHEHWRGRI